MQVERDQTLPATLGPVLARRTIQVEQWWNWPCS